jgi:hypothetical protein
VCCSCLGWHCRDLRRYRWTNEHVHHGIQSLLVRGSLYAVGEIPLPHTPQRAERDGLGAGEEESHG